MTNKNEKWKVVNRRLAYDNFLRLYEEDIELPGGEIIQYTVNRSGDAAAILLTPKPSSLLLAYQYRYPINKWIYDLPGGKIKEGEEPEEAAIRECIEETGYKPLRLKKLIQYYPSPSRSDGLLHIFFSDAAEKIKEKKPYSVNNAEDVGGEIIMKAEVKKLIQDNDIIDPALLIAWHTARLHGKI